MTTNIKKREKRPGFAQDACKTPETQGRKRRTRHQERKKKMFGRKISGGG